MGKGKKKKSSSHREKCQEYERQGRRLANKKRRVLKDATRAKNPDAVAQKELKKVANR